MFLRSAPDGFFPAVRDSPAKGFRGLAQHDSDCRWHHSDSYRFSIVRAVTANLIPVGANGAEGQESVSFVPLAMPIMFGPGGIATLIGMAATMHLSRGGLETYAASFLAIAATMVVTCLSLTYASKILTRIGPKGIDAATRITGFFVSAMGMGLLLGGVVEFLQSYGIMTSGGVVH